MGLDWIHLGTVYFAGLLCDYGFSFDVLIAAFPKMISPETVTALEFLDEEMNNFSDEIYRKTVDFMSCRGAELATAAARTVMRHPRLAVSSVDLFSDCMAGWILQLDDVQLFEAFLKLGHGQGMPYYRNKKHLLELAAKSGASRIAHALVFARKPPSAKPSQIAL
ncbi:hypothetical protein HK405_006236, partial [Cladochytrium tenue]